MNWYKKAQSPNVQPNVQPNVGYNPQIANQGLQQYDPNKQMQPAQIKEFQNIIAAAENKLVAMINGNPQVKSQWPIVKQFMEKNKSIDMQNNQSAPPKFLIKSPEGTQVTENQQGYLIVPESIYNFSIWRKIIMNAKEDIQNIAQWSSNSPPKTLFFQLMSKISFFLKN